MKRKTIVALTVLALVVMTQVGAHEASAQSTPICGGAVPFSGNAECTLVANGSEVRVMGAAASPIQITYSLLTPVLPGAASVHVTLTKPDGTGVAACSFGFFVAAACYASGPPVARGTPLTCAVAVYAFSGGGTYSCLNGGPDS